MTADGAYGGLLLAVTVILADGMRRCAPAALSWLRHGFASPRAVQQRTAAVFLFAGILLFHFRQLTARSIHSPIDPEVSLWIGFAANVFMGFGGALYHAARVAAEGSVKRGRQYLWGAAIVMALCAAGVPFVLPLHPPVQAVRGGAR